MKEIRRQDRLLDPAGAQEVLESGLYGFLSLGAGDDGYAYGVPMSYAYDRAANAIYFHCAPEGHKLDCLERDDRVSFCVVDGVQTVPEHFTTRYRSVIAFGRLRAAVSNDERREALRLLVRKYCPGLEVTGETYMERSLHRTQTLRLDIERITAKAKK